MKAVRLLGLVCVCAAALAADTSPPISPSAVSAQRKYDSVVEKAGKEYTRAVVAGDKQLITDLQAALKTAMNSKDLAEAERIEAAIAGAKEKLEEHNGGAEPSAIAGKWDIQYSNNAHAVWLIGNGGAVQWPAEGKSAVLRGGLLDFKDGAMIRVSPVGNRLLLEYFYPKTYPSGTPVLGLGVRTK